MVFFIRSSLNLLVDPDCYGHSAAERLRNGLHGAAGSCRIPEIRDLLVCSDQHNQLSLGFALYPIWFQSFHGGNRLNRSKSDATCGRQVITFVMQATYVYIESYVTTLFLSQGRDRPSQIRNGEGTEDRKEDTEGFSPQRHRRFSAWWRVLDWWAGISALAAPCEHE